MIDVRPKILVHLAATGSLKIHDPMDAGVNFRNVVCAARLEQNSVAGVAQDRHQREHVLLQKRFAAGDLDQRTLKTRDSIDDLFKRSFLAFVKRVFGIAIIAAQIAEGEPDKDTALARPGALALDRLVNLVDRQRLFVHSTLA